MLPIMLHFVCGKCHNMQKIIVFKIRMVVSAKRTKPQTFSLLFNEQWNGTKYSTVVL